MLNITIKYSRLGNKFFFISNLSNWHFSCQPKYNSIWIKKTGKLNGQEKKALDILKTILQKYKFGDTRKKWRYLGHYFLVLPEPQCWKSLKKQVTKREWKQLHWIFDIFDPRFQTIWESEKRTMLRAKETIQNKLQRPMNRQLGEDLKILFNQILQKSSIVVILLMRPTGIPWNIGGGNANFGKNIITIEGGDVTPRKTRRLTKVLMTVYHEIIHASLARPLFEQKIRKFISQIPSELPKKSNLFKQVQSLFTIINEGVVSSLIPQGYLAEKYFSQNPRRAFSTTFPHGKPTKQQASSMRAWRIYTAYKLRAEVKSYLHAKRRLDERYIKKTYDAFVEFCK